MRGVVGSVLGMINRGATHVGVATDHVIESFRNRLWPGYKTGAGIDPDLLSQFGLLEEALQALGVTVWPMVEYEADDALAAAAVQAAADPRRRAGDHLHARQGPRAVRQRHPHRPAEPAHQRRSGTRRAWWRSSASVPASIPDYLALVGDAADGYPGLAGWGAKSSAAVLARYGHLEAIPEPTGAPGASTPPIRPPVGHARRAIASARSCSAISRRCGPRSPCSATSTNCAGPDRRRPSRRSRRGWIARARGRPEKGAANSRGAAIQVQRQVPSLPTAKSNALPSAGSERHSLPRK